MPRAAIREPAPRDLHQSIQARNAAATATAATGRLLAGIETAVPHGPPSTAGREALRRHGTTLHRAGGAALVSMAFSDLCAAAPARASRRFDLLADAWGDLLSKGGRP